MSNPPVRVPSKAAIRALRGLVFGTTCSLAVLAEDRRRRINMARKAISNGERLKSAKEYHSGGAALAIALEEEVAGLDYGPLPWNPTDGPRRTTNQELLSWTAMRGDKERSKRTLAAPSSTVVVDYVPPELAEISTDPHSLEQKTSDKRRMLPLPAGFILPLPSAQSPEPVQDRGLSLQRKLGPEVALLNTKDALAQITALLDDGSIDSLDTAVTLLQDTLGLEGREFGDCRQGLIDASMRLSQRVQAAERMDLAHRVLQVSLQAGLVDQSNYISYNPCAIIESLLPECMPVSRKDSVEHARLQAALQIFRPGLLAPHWSDAGSTTISSQFAKIGRLLLLRAIALRDRRSISSLVMKRLPFLFDYNSGLYVFVVTRLQEAGIHTLVVRLFLKVPIQVNWKGYLRHREFVVRSVASRHGYRADEVLVAMFSHQYHPSIRSRYQTALETPDQDDNKGVTIPTVGIGRDIGTASIAELLYLHWQRNRDFDASKALFDDRIKPNIYRVKYPECIFRVMVQISLEAGRSAEADSYADQQRYFNPDAPTDIRLLGLFARSQAEQGDWDGVRSTFLKMRTRGGVMSQDSSREFVPVFKEYLRTHTIGETEDFLKYYITEIKGTLCREMVPLLANEYAAMKDLNAFVSWLKFCVEAGFAVDEAFSVAILTNAWRHWNCSFAELRTLYRRLHALSPAFVGPRTEHIMLRAATAEAGTSVGLGMRLKSIGRKANFSNLSSPIWKANNEHGLNTAMKRAIILRRPRQAIHLYKQATLEQGMRHSAKCLGLAVFASLKAHDGNAEEAISLIAAARAQGLDTKLADTTVLIDTISRISSAAPRTTIYRDLSSTLQRLADSGCPISDHALNVAAHRVLAAGHAASAVVFALSAADAAGQRPGYNKWNFSTLVGAYGLLAEPAGLHRVITHAARTPDFDNVKGFKALKRARGCLMKMPSDKLVNQSLWHVNQGIKVMKRARADHMEDKEELQNAVLGIMRQAAIDAGGVVEDEVPIQLEVTDGRLPEWLDAATAEMPLEQQDEGVEEYEVVPPLEEVEEHESVAAGNNNAGYTDSWMVLEQSSLAQAHQAKQVQNRPAWKKTGATALPEPPHPKSVDPWLALEKNCRAQSKAERASVAAVPSF